MSRRQEHACGAILASVGVAVASTRELPPLQAFAESIGLVIGGIYGGRLPDRLEPARQPNHRHFAHSAALGTGMTIVLVQCGPSVRDVFRDVGCELIQARGDHEQGSWQWCLLSAFAVGAFVLAGVTMGAPVGYLSHLGLDHVKSKRGIPLLT